MVANNLAADRMKKETAKQRRDKIMRSKSVEAAKKGAVARRGTELTQSLPDTTKAPTTPTASDSKAKQLYERLKAQEKLGKEAPIREKMGAQSADAKSAGNASKLKTQVSQVGEKARMGSMGESAGKLVIDADGTTHFINGEGKKFTSRAFKDGAVKMFRNASKVAGSRLGAVGRLAGRAAGATLPAMAVGEMVDVGLSAPPMYPMRQPGYAVDQFGAPKPGAAPQRQPTSDPGINPGAQASRIPEPQPQAAPRLTPESFKNPGQPTTATQVPNSPQPKSSAPVGGVQTKGGFYPSYAKSSQEAGDFRTEFGKAVSTGSKNFLWQGRLYNTNMK